MATETESTAGNGKVRLGGVELAVGDPTVDFAEGTAVTVCIRPEDVLARGITAGAPNAFEAIVSELEFLGSFFRANLTARGTNDTKFRADFSVNLVRDIGVAQGNSLTVALPEDRIRVFAGP
ncbi:MAG: TOBE domain-containing protein [Kiloniellales bacterium]